MARPGGESDALKLVGQERLLEQAGAQRVGLRFAADLLQLAADPVPGQHRVHVLFRVTVNGDPLAQSLQPADALQQVPHILDRPVLQRRCDPSRLARKAVVGKQHPQLRLLAVAQGNAEVRPAVGLLEPLPRKAPPHLLLDVHDVLAGPEGVDLEVRAGTVRLTPPQAPQGHPVGLARSEIGDAVIGPYRLRIRGFEAHLLLAHALRPLFEGPLHQLLVAERLYRRLVRRRHGQTEGQLFLQNQGKGRSGVVAGLAAGAAAVAQPAVAAGIQLDGDLSAV
jgi:hypothetical protein